MVKKKDEPPAAAPTVITYNEADLKGERKQMGGSMSDVWNDILAGQAVSALWTGHSSPEERNKQYVATVAALHGIHPKDEIEAMIAAQMIAGHSAIMECFRRAMIKEQSAEGRQDNLNAAAKLSRSFAVLVEALDGKRRIKGRQSISVKHIHVNANNAIVGDVAGAGGARTKQENQSHALEYAPGTTLWGEIETEREAVPIAGNAEWALPDARRDKPGRT